MRNGTPALLLLTALLALSPPANAQNPAVGTISPVGRWTANGRPLVSTTGDRL